MLKKLLLGLALTMCLSSIAFAQEEPKLYTLRLGQAVIQGEEVTSIGSIRFYKPTSILNWIPIVRDLGLTAGVTLDENKRYMIGGSYEVNSICDLNGGWAFSQDATSKTYLALSLYMKVFSEIVDLLQKVIVR